MDNNKNRLYDKRIEINQDKIKDFFNKQGQKANKKNAASSTMFTDNHTAEKRDLIEKKLFLENIKLNKNFKIIDIGCGVGRWGEIFKDYDYLGLDYSEELLNIAKNNYSDNKNIKFQLMAADNINLEKLEIPPPFDIIIITGCLIYINDKQLDNVFKSINDLSSDNTIFYMREPIAIEKRLTLNEFYSDEIKKEYSAIYRKESDYLEYFNRLNRFKLLKSGDIYNKNLHERDETVHRFFILKRGNNDK